MHCPNKMDLTCTDLMRCPNRTAEIENRLHTSAYNAILFCGKEESVYFLNDCIYTNEFEKIHMKVYINKHVTDTCRIRYEH